MRNQNGKSLIKIILDLFIVIMFVLILYTCLDMFEIIDVPKKYSIADWLDSKLGSSYEVEYRISNEAQDGTQRVKKQIVKNETDEDTIVVVLPTDSEWDNFNVNQNGSNPGKVGYWYYDQLDEYGKTIYKALEKNLDNMKSGTYNIDFGKEFDDLLHEDDGEDRLNNSFQFAINALNFDNPNIFYIDISKVYLLTKITQRFWGTTYEVEIGASQGQSYLNDDFSNKNDVEEATKKIEQEKEFIKSRLGKDTEYRIKGVHDYLVNNLQYDTTISRDNIYNIYGALINRVTVCEGYARAFKSIMDDLDIPCIVACGTAINNSGETETHAWNYVSLNGQWYAVDVTWDDPVIIGTGYINNEVYKRYFLKGADEFFKNHTEDGEIVDGADFKYPVLSREDY